MGSPLRSGVVVCWQVDAFSYFAGSLFYLDARSSRRRSSRIDWSSYLWCGHRSCFPCIRTTPPGLDVTGLPFRGEERAPAPTHRNTGSGAMVFCCGPWSAAPNHSHLNVVFDDCLELL